MIARTHDSRLVACLLLLVISGTSHAQSNEAGKSSLASIELAFGIDTEAETVATNEIAVCMRERRWQDLAVAASNAVQRWPREQYFENWLTALERLNDTASLPDVCRRYIDRCPQQRQSLYYRWASAMRRANRAGEAIAQLRDWGKAEPKDTTISRCLACELITEKRYDEAIKVLKDATEYASDDYTRRSIMDLAIDAMEAKGDVSAAIEAAGQALAEAVAAKDGNYFLQQSAGKLVGLLRKSDRVGLYIASLEKRLDGNAGDTKLRRMLAEIAALSGDNARALKYRRLLAEDGNGIKDLVQLREALERTGATNEEVAVIEKILAVEGSRITYRALSERLATLYASTGATDKAWALLDEALAEERSPDAYAKASGIAQRAGDKDRANRWIDEALRRKPHGYAATAVATQLVALGRYREALDLTFPAKTRLSAGMDYYRTPVLQALVKAGQTNMVLERLNEQADTHSTNAVAWRQLATFYHEAQDFTNAAACWQRVVELTGNEFDYQPWLRALEKTDDVGARLKATLQYAKRSANSASAVSHSLLQLARSLHTKGQTNDLETISDLLLSNPHWDVEHENMGRLFDSLAMPDRAIRHLKAGLDNFERNGLIPQGDHMRRQLWSILLKYKRNDELIDCLKGAARHGGAIVVAQPTLARCADAIGPELWTNIVAAGESPGATIAQQVMAVFMLNASNLYARSSAVLQGMYDRDPSAGAFNLLRDNCNQRRDQTALLSLYTNHLARAPGSRTNGEFVTGLLAAYSAANPAAGIPFAKEVATTFGRDHYLALEAAQLLQRASRYDDAMAVYTNAFAGGRNNYVLMRIVSLLEQMGQPAKAALAAFHGKTLFASSCEAAECTRALDRLARKPEVPRTVMAWAEAAQKGKTVDCLFADKIDWPAALAWAAAVAGDYTKAIAFHRTAYEKSPTPAAGRALASLLFKAGSADEAIAIQVRAIQDTPQAEKYVPRTELIRMTVADHRYEKAGALIDETLADAPGAATKKELDDIRREVESGIRQEEFVKKALDRADTNPTDAPAQRSAAQALRLTGRPARAAAYYRRALVIEDLPATRWDLAYVLTSTRQHKEAIAEYEALIGGDLSAQERDAAIKAVAESYDALGDARKALEFLTARLDSIRSSTVRSWALARIQALRAANE